MVLSQTHVQLDISRQVLTTYWKRYSFVLQLEGRSTPALPALKRSVEEVLVAARAHPECELIASRLLALLKQRDQLQVVTAKFADEADRYRERLATLIDNAR